MPVLTLNGITVPIAYGSAKTKIKGMDSDASITGALRRFGNYKKRSWEFVTPLLSPEEAAAFRGLIEGQGQHWKFDATAYSDNGLPYFNVPSGITYPATTYTGDSPKHPPVLQVDNSALWYGLPSVPEWTLICVGLFPTYVSWPSYVWRSDGAIYKNGIAAPGTDMSVVAYLSDGTLQLTANEVGHLARPNSTAITVGRKYSADGHVHKCITSGTTAASPPTFAGYLGTTQDGSAVWQNIGISNVRIADLVWVPYEVPDAWVPQISTYHLANPWSPLPITQAAGSLMPAATTTQVLGQVTDTEVAGFMGASGWVPNGEALTFTLFEV
jgi:hypothetical protein